VIYVTGDVHGDISRFKRRELRRLKKGDSLIVCGDFGFLWDGSKEERSRLKWLGTRRYNLLFVEGGHDNLELLHSYPKTEWNSGEVRVISGRLMQLVRGGVFEIDGKRIFAFGGGEPGERDVAAGDDFSQPEAIPTPEELEAAKAKLAEHGNKVDYIVTHQSSLKIRRFLDIGTDEAGVLDLFLNWVRENCSYKRWFFGSYHIDKLIPPGEAALFQSFAEMGEDCALMGLHKRRSVFTKKFK
jgi:predicted phosphodiesterase